MLEGRTYTTKAKNSKTTLSPNVRNCPIREKTYIFDTETPPIDGKSWIWVKPVSPTDELTHLPWFFLTFKILQMDSSLVFTVSKACRKIPMLKS
jgi:hypothetical protein